MMRIKNKHIISIAAAVAWLLAGTTGLQAQSRLSLSLGECLGMASSADVSVRNAALDVSSARARKQEALAEYFPTVSATALGFHSLDPLLDIGVIDILGHSDMAWTIKNYVDGIAPQYDLPTHYRTLQYGYGATVSVTQPIFAGGRIVSGNRLASLGIEAAELQKAIAVRDSGLEIERKYWQIISLKSKVETLDKALEMLTRLSEDAASAVSAGLVSDSDLLQVNLKVNELKSKRLQAVSGIRLLKMDLFNSIGQDYSVTSLCADESAPYIDDIDLSGALGGRGSPGSHYQDEEGSASATAETRLLGLQVRAKELEKKMAVGEALPTVALGGMYGYGHYIGDGAANGALYAMVKIPLSDWGKTSKKIIRYNNEIEKAKNEEEYLGEMLVLKSRKLWLDLTTAWEEKSIAEESVSIAEDSLMKIEANYKAGLSTLSELLQAETSLRQSQDALTDALISYRESLTAWQNQ
ncbi:MAG: TolC family protein [Bacteroidales bacterium]|nr:TolC family protein [Bacteroidales bacterium]